MKQAIPVLGAMMLLSTAATYVLEHRQIWLVAMTLNRDIRPTRKKTCGK